MQGKLHARVAFQQIDERLVRSLECMRKDRIEVPDRLMIVNAKKEINVFHRFAATGVGSDDCLNLKGNSSVKKSNHGFTD
jgi:hypothetical protein